MVYLNKAIFGDLEKKVLAWAKEKEILEKSSPIKQMIKTEEEVLELERAIRMGNRPEIIDGLGDVLVTLIIQAELNNLKLVDCLEVAYEVISKRTGKMVNGLFVKDVK